MTTLTDATATTSLVPLDGLCLSVAYVDVREASRTFVWFTPLEEAEFDELARQWSALTYSRQDGPSEEAVALAARYGVVLPTEPVNVGAFGSDPSLSFGEWRRLDQEYQSLHHAYLTSLAAALGDARSRLLARSGAFEFGDEWISGSRTFSDDADAVGYSSGRVRLTLRDGEIWSCAADGYAGYADLDAVLLSALDVADVAEIAAEARNLQGVLAMSHLELLGVTSASVSRGDVIPDEVLALTASEFADAAEARRADLLATRPWRNGPGLRLVSQGVLFDRDPRGPARSAHDQYLSRFDVARVPYTLVTELLEVLRSATFVTNSAFSGEWGPEVDAELLARGLTTRE